MYEIKRQLIAGINNYKEVRAQLYADASLSEEEKVWLLEKCKRSLYQQSQMLELELS